VTPGDADAETVSMAEMSIPLERGAPARSEDAAAAGDK
jgi:hypothetical protein